MTASLAEVLGCNHRYKVNADRYTTFGHAHEFDTSTIELTSW